MFDWFKKYKPMEIFCDCCKKKREAIVDAQFRLWTSNSNEPLKFLCPDCAEKFKQKGLKEQKIRQYTLIIRDFISSLEKNDSLYLKAEELAKELVKENG